MAKPCYRAVWSWLPGFQRVSGQWPAVVATGDLVEAIFWWGKLRGRPIFSYFYGVKRSKASSNWVYSVPVRLLCTNQLKDDVFGRVPKIGFNSDHTFVWITWDEGLFQNGAYTQNCKFYVETYDKGRGFEVPNFEICHISRYLGKPWSDSLVVEMLAIYMEIYGANHQKGCASVLHTMKWTDSLND